MSEENTMRLLQEPSPHVRRKDSATRMMLDVLLALLPLLIFSFIVYRLDALKVFGIAVPAMMIAEWVFVMFKGRMPYDGEKHPFKEKFLHALKLYRPVNAVAPAVSALIFGMCLPPSTSWWGVLVGALAGIIFGKLLFGGLGQNIFNPAAVGMILTRLSFSNTMSYPAIPWGEGTMVDVVTGGTILSGTIQGGYASLMDVSLLDLFLGRTQGAMGEVCKVLILVGLLYLLLRQAIDWRVTFTYIGAFTALIAIAGIAIAGGGIVKDFDIWHFIGVEFLAGGMLFGATFMLTDPVTMPATKPGRYIYALSAASLTVLIRLFASAPEGVGYSILLANLITPVLDHHKVASSRWTWKKWLTIGLILLADILFIVIGIIFGGKVK